MSFSWGRDQDESSRYYEFSRCLARYTESDQWVSIVGLQTHPLKEQDRANQKEIIPGEIEMDEQAMVTEAFRRAHGFQNVCTATFYLCEDKWFADSYQHVQQILTGKSRWGQANRFPPRLMWSPETCRHYSLGPAELSEKRRKLEERRKNPNMKAIISKAQLDEEEARRKKEQASDTGKVSH